ncbi:MAG: hypothetical protein H6865_08655 [Rhodospirillales bacterium]|nr:hypothetical protein [Alphaproteobacteria bacterium]MCB9987686.1 hypothetical protein [Rhodospirillales bacterium]USO08015.1 MAG: hypothetical protein H6866_02010 [Rhodospirillales bacterium]
MTMVLAAPAARKSAVDVLFTSQSLPEQLNPHFSNPQSALENDVETEDSGETGRGSASGSGSSGFKLGISLFDLAPRFEGNIPLARLNLIERIKLSREALWRNPVRARIGEWGRREVMHIFNGRFHQSLLSEWDRYETFGRCYTCPDPFRNDDPPWTPCFCA